MTEVQYLVDQLNRAYFKDAWHGSTVTEVLDGLSAQQAAAHPIDPAHSIWEIVRHMTAWKNAVRLRLLGQAVDLSPEEDWPAVTATDSAAWISALEDLKNAHDQLAATAGTLSEKEWHEIIPGRQTSRYFQLTGILQHDAYHAGQIVMLKKLV